LNEVAALTERQRPVEDDVPVKHGTSKLGVKNKDVELKAGSKLAKRIEPEVFDMITKSYASIGGHAMINSPEDIGGEYKDWVVADVDDDPDVDTFVGGNLQPNGSKKLSVSATDGSVEAKAHMMNLKRKLFKNGWWAETSDAPAHIALNKLKIKPVESEEQVRALLGGKEITWHGKHPEGKFPGTNGWYTRKIGGTPHTKIIIGDV